MSDMVREEILPACVAYEKDLADTVKSRRMPALPAAWKPACSAASPR